nr:hypothetical protein BHI3_35480 [Bacteriovorax sp. HI3]
MKKLVKNISGFTLVETLIAAGVAGAIGLIVVTMMSNSRKMVNTTLVASESSFLKNQVIAYVSTPEICMRNFNGKTIGTVASPTSYTALSRRLPNNTISNFLEVNKSYGQAKNAAGGSDLLTVRSIATSLSPDKANIMNLTVKYDILNTVKQNNNKTSDSFTIEIFIGKDEATKTLVTSCFTDTAKMIRDAVRASCKPDAGGTVTYNPDVMPYGECMHHRIVVKNAAGNVVPTATLPAQTLCPPNQFLAEVVIAPGTTSSTSTTPGTITYQCKTLTLNAPCAAGSFLKGIDPNGNSICVSLASIVDPMPDGFIITTTTGGYVAADLNCDTDYVLKSYSSSGKVCVPKTITQNCPAPNQYVTEVRADGSVVCSSFPKRATACPSGQYIKQVNADGSIAACGTPVLPAATCADQRYVMTAIDSNGNPTCTPTY